MTDQGNMDSPLHELVHFLATASRSQEAAGVILDAALSMVQADSGYIEQALDREQVEIVGVRGREDPALGTRVPFPGSLTDEVIESGEPEMIDDVGRIPHPIDRALAGSCRACRALVVPLAPADNVLGALVLLRHREQPAFTAVQASRAALLADLGSNALRRIRLLDEATHAHDQVTAILESITDAFLALDRDFRLTYVNHSAREVIAALSGYDRGGLIGAVLQDAVPEIRGTRFEAEFRRAMETRKPTDFAEFFPPLNAWFEVHARPTEDGLGVYFRDVTEQMRGETGLRVLAEAGDTFAKSLDFRKTLTAVARLAVPDLADWCVIDVAANGTAERLEVAVGDPDKEELAREYRSFAPRLDDPESPVARVLRTGEPELLPEITTEWIRARMAEPEQARLARELGMRSVMVVPLAARGRILGALSFVSAGSGRSYGPADLDLALELGRRGALAIDTARLFEESSRARDEAERRAREEAALRRAAAAVGSTFTIKEMVREIVQSALAATDSEGAVMERIAGDGTEIEVVAVAGERALPSGSRVDYPGSLAELVLEREQPRLIPVVGEAPEKISPDLRKACSDCSALAVPFMDARGPIGALILLRGPALHPFQPEETVRASIYAELAALAFRKVELLEESERGRMELAQFLESRSRLMRGFSHDVKNPLGAADGYLQLIEAGMLGPIDPQQQHGIARARGAIGDALRLIDDLLDLARSESGRIEIERAPVDVRTVAQETAEEFRVRASSKGLALELRLSDAVPTIESDTRRIRQILANLLSNAVKYTRRGSVTVTVEPRDGDGPAPGRWIATHVRDTGPGISEVQQKVLFEEFKRLDTAGTERGVGIGLAISCRLTVALGGRLTVESHVGEGSTFTLWLPVEFGAGPPQIERPAPATRSWRNRREDSRLARGERE